MSIILRKGVLSILNNLRNMSVISGTVENTIRCKLQTMLEATYVDVVNDSSNHNVPRGSETHFQVVVISNKFDGLPLIKRHRMVNDILKEELQSGVHALSIVAKTPKQWDECGHKVDGIPNCRGGYGK